MTAAALGEAPLDPRRKYLLRHTTREVRARVDRIDHLWNISTQARESAPATLNMNDIGRVAPTLARPVFPDRYVGQPRDRKPDPDRRGDEQYGRGCNGGVIIA